MPPAKQTIRERISDQNAEGDSGAKLDGHCRIVSGFRPFVEEDIECSVVDRRTGNKGEDAAQQEHQRRGVPQCGKPPTAQGENKSGEKRGQKHRAGKRRNDPVGKPGDTTGEGTENIVFGAHLKQNGKSGRADGGSQHLDEQLYHSRIPPNAAFHISRTHPTPAAMPPAMSTASVKRTSPAI